MTPHQDLSARLLPCPFCGGNPKLYLGRGAYGVKCTCSGKAFIQTYGNAVPADNSSEARAVARCKAIAAWNTRAPTDHERAVQAAVAKAVEAEREACAEMLGNQAEDLEADASRFLHGTDPHHSRMAFAHFTRKQAAAIRSRGVAG